MASSQSATSSVHDFTVKDAKGNEVDLSTYKGKVLLIVNVASKCGLTNSNYTEAEPALREIQRQRFRDIGFPCNQFGAEEPVTNEEILQIACTCFKAEYPIFDKVKTKAGISNHQLNKNQYFKSLLFTLSLGGCEWGECGADLQIPQEKQRCLLGDNIKWNFSKFFVYKDGHVVDRYAPTTSPLSFEIMDELEELVNFESSDELVEIICFL